MLSSVYLDSLWYQIKKMDSKRIRMENGGSLEGGKWGLNYNSGGEDPDG